MSEQVVQALDERPTELLPATGSRTRQWLAAALVLLLATALSLAWGWWVMRRTTEHPSQRIAAGQPWHQPDGSSVTLKTWRETTSLVDDDGEAKASAPGTSWVFVELQYTGVTDQTDCVFTLVGDEGLRWRTSSDAPLLEGFTFCTEDGAGRDPLVHGIFQVPTDMLDDLRAVAFTHSAGLDQPPWLVKP